MHLHDFCLLTPCRLLCFCLPFFASFFFFCPSFCALFAPLLSKQALVRVSHQRCSDDEHDKGVEPVNLRTPWSIFASFLFGVSLKSFIICFFCSAVALFFHVSDVTPCAVSRHFSFTSLLFLLLHLVVSNFALLALAPACRRPAFERNPHTYVCVPMDRYISSGANAYCDPKYLIRHTFSFCNVCNVCRACKGEKSRREGIS